MKSLKDEVKDEVKTKDSGKCEDEEYKILSEKE